MGIKAQLKIMNAFREGKPIQRVCTGGVGYYPWEDVSGDHSFDFNIQETKKSSVSWMNCTNLSLLYNSL